MSPQRALASEDSKHQVTNMISTSILEPDILEETQQILHEYESTSFAQKWQIIDPTQAKSAKAQDTIHRLNSLGSLFYYIKIVLRKRRLSDSLHKDMCENLERTHLKEVIEIPRDHFKTTIHSEGAPMWWGLPFTLKDEGLMRQLGYDEEWIEWMKRTHDQDTRLLLISENIENACKIGRRINNHYVNNDFFKRLFPEIIPDATCNWSIQSMTHKRSNTADSGQGEGTFDYIGVGGALQSRHYKKIIEDDLVGKAALGSEIVMNDTIDYHKLLPGAYDSPPGDPDFDGDEVVVGNRWSYKDLNWHIRKHEPEFRITTHSALGGCCTKHVAGEVIFPEEWTVAKLERWKRRFGSYFFSCQFLNSPTPPGDTKFKTEYINYFTFGRITGDNLNKKVIIKHEVKKGGEVIKDVMPSSLNRSMILDPNHAGTEGRSRHAIIVTGFVANPVRIYMLDLYADNSSHHDIVEKYFELGEKWKIKEPWMETVAAQKWLKFHIETISETRRKLGKWTFRKINELRVDHGKDAKINRIESLEPLFARGEFWMLKFGMERFIQEYTEYPYSPTLDILDVLGLSQQTWDVSIMSDKDQIDFMTKQNAQFRLNKSRNTMTGY